MVVVLVALARPPHGVLGVLVHDDILVLGAAAVCIACAALICKAAKKKLGKKVLAVIGAAAFVGAILAVILIARTPMPL